MGSENFHFLLKFVVFKDRNELLAAVKRLTEDDDFCTEISRKCRKLYEDKHSQYSVGINVGNALIRKDCLTR